MADLPTKKSAAANIQQRTVYFDDFIADAALFNIYAGASLVLVGDDQFNNDAIAMAGQLRVLGPLEISALTVEDTAAIVNTAKVTQTGDMALGSSDDDAVIVRNLPSATWDVAGSVNISALGDSRFVNLGLFEVTNADDGITVDANFLSRGTLQTDGILSFDGTSTRVFGAVTGTGSFGAGNVFLDGAQISTSSCSFGAATVHGVVSVSSATAFYVTDLYLQAGSQLQFLGHTQTISLGNVYGTGEIDLQGSNSLSAFTPLSLALVGDLKLINSGHVSMIPGGGGGGNDSISLWAQTKNGGTAEIDNLAGATWTDTASSTFFIGDGTADTFLSNAGVFQDIGDAGFTNFELNVVNNGVIESGVANPSPQLTYNGYIFEAGVTGAGTIDVGVDPVTLYAPVAASQTVAFTLAPSGYASPTLTLGDVNDFAATITGFDLNGAYNDQIVVNSASQFDGFSPNSGGTGGALLFSNGASVLLKGAYDPAQFHAAVTGGGTIITYG